MTGRFRFRLRHAAIAAASLLLAAIGAAAFVLGTDAGTRWVLGHAVRFVPGDLDIADYDGTLLRGLRISRLDYSYAAIRLSADDLTLEPDWLRSNRGRIALRKLLAERISYSSTKSGDAEPKPLHIAMPALPVNIAVAELGVRELQVGERKFSGLAASDVRLHGNRIRANRVAGRMGDIQAGFEELDTTLSGDVPMQADVSWRLGDGPWSGEGRVDGTLAELGFEQAVTGTWPAQVNGTVYLLRRIEPEIDATVRYASWQFGEISVNDGLLQVSGTVNAYRVALDTGVSDGQARSLELSGEVSGDMRGLRTIDVVASGSVGRIAARGTLAWSPSFAAELTMQAQDVDPSQIAALKPGALDANLRLEARSGQDYVLQIDNLTGSYDGQDVNASGRVVRLQEDWRCTACDVALGPNRVHIDGEANADRLQAAVRIDAPELGRAYSPLGGALTADLRLAGTVAEPQVSGTAAGSGVHWQDWAMASFSAESRSSTRDRVDLDLVFEGLRRDDSSFGSGSLRLAGGRESIDSSADWTLGELRAEFVAVIALLEDGARADIRSAVFSEPRAGTWRLVAPVSLALSGASVSTGPQSWEYGNARLDVQRLRYDGELKDLDASLVALPLELMNAFLPDDIRLAGRVDAELLLTETDGARSGSLAWKQSDTVVRVTQPRGEPVDMLVPVARADFELAGDAVQGRAQVEIEPEFKASLDLATEGLADDSPLRARLLLNGTEWEWITALFPEIDNFKGVISADASANGTLATPELQGELRWQEGELAVPALNLPLTEIEVTVTGSSTGDAIVKGSATAGSGKLTLDGRLEDLLSDSRSFTAELGGRRALLLNWPDYRLTATPDVVISGDSGGIKVGGGVAVDQATISLRELPEGAVTPSQDVRVRGRTEAPRNRLPVSGDLELELGKNVHILAFGLDTNLEGSLRFTAVPNRDPRAEGKLELVGGKFSSYGQDLTIEEGTLTFTGPLDDPIVLVRAVRIIEGVDGTVTAGLELRGRAQNVSSSVFSRPAMSEADALSYLVIGRPMEQATVADGSMLSGTAYALGLRQAATITNQLGQNLGLDQLSVGGSNQSTTELVAGKQVNSRLYVRYAYGVFTEIGNLLLRYRLSERLTIEAGTGESQSMDLLYLVEKP